MRFVNHLILFFIYILHSVATVLELGMYLKVLAFHSIHIFLILRSPCLLHIYSWQVSSRSTCLANLRPFWLFSTNFCHMIVSSSATTLFVFVCFSVIQMEKLAAHADTVLRVKVPVSLHMPSLTLYPCARAQRHTHTYTGAHTVEV